MVSEVPITQCHKSTTNYEGTKAINEAVMTIPYMLSQNLSVITEDRHQYPSRDSGSHSRDSNQARSENKSQLAFVSNLKSWFCINRVYEILAC
jgi:hypothetical protein